MFFFSAEQFRLCQMDTFAKPIHAALSNYGYDTAQGRSRVGGNPQVKIQLGTLIIMAHYRCFNEFCTRSPNGTRLDGYV